jgi:hypothetical protein
MKKKLLALTFFILLPIICQASGFVFDGPSGSAAVTNGRIGSTVNSSSVSVVAGKMFTSIFTTTTAGTVSYGHIYVATSPASTATICLSLHTSDFTNHLSGSNNTIVTSSFTGWANFSLGGSYNILAVTNYYLTIQTSVTFSVGTGAYTASPPCSTPNESTCYVSASYSCGQNLASLTLSSSRPMMIIFDNQPGNPS